MSFFIVYAVLAGISCLSIVFIICYVYCCKIQFLRYFLHLFWIIIMILMVLTFILGSVFGIIGLISTDGISVLKWIFGSENLSSQNPKYIGTGESAQYINICLNGNNLLSFNIYDNFLNLKFKSLK